MTIRVYSSTDTGSPGGITNAAGQMIGVLDVLVNGYSPGTVSSITRSGSTATLTFSAAHGMAVDSKGNRITTAGAVETEYNGEFLVEVPDTTSVTYTVTGTPATPATGTITATKAGCGWTKPYTGTNLAAYRQGTGSNGFYLRVDDTGTTSARVVGYETMSDVNTGTGDFPTAAQLAGGAYMLKSDGATARAWIIVATETYFYWWTNFSGNTVSAVIQGFVDLDSFATADGYGTLLGMSTSAGVGLHSLYSGENSITNYNYGNFLARSYTQTGTSVLAGKSWDYIGSRSNYQYTGTGGETYPSPAGSGLNTSLIYVHESVAITRRGTLPGLLCPLHNKPLTHLDTYDGTGVLAGQTYLALGVYNSGQIHVRVV